MAINKPSFSTLVAHYPSASNDFGSGGRIINNPAYEHACALSLSYALERAAPGFLDHFTGRTAVHLEGRPGHYNRVQLPYARGAKPLARYLSGSPVGWTHHRLIRRRDAVRLRTQGIIYWEVKSSSTSPDHIDLWDPVVKSLKAYGKRTMRWAPLPNDISYIWFWELAR